jgi:dihydrofolate reductase
LKTSTSVDGFVGGPDDGIEWVLDSDPEATTQAVETIRNASLHIMGSRTFHDMADVPRTRSTSGLRLTARQVVAMNE